MESKKGISSEHVLLTKKESDKIMANMRKSGINPKKQIKIIKFHKDFSKGMRLYLCKKCGYPSMFWGAPIDLCECAKPDKKIYDLKDSVKFISDLQKMHKKFVTRLQKMMDTVKHYKKRINDFYK